MILTTEEKHLLFRMIDFCEENWAAFLQRCEEAGVKEEEVEQNTDKLREKIS